MVQSHNPLNINTYQIPPFANGALTAAAARPLVGVSDVLSYGAEAKWTVGFASVCIAV